MSDAYELTPGDLLRQVVAIGRAAEAIVLHSRVVERQLRVLLQKSQETADGGSSSANTPGASTPSTDVSPDTTVEPDCLCPPNRRRVAPAPGLPARTQCRLCSRFHS